MNDRRDERGEQLKMETFDDLKREPKHLSAPWDCNINELSVPQFFPTRFVRK